MHIKGNNNSPHGKFHRFLFPFSSKFSDLNFAPHVLYIYSCYEQTVSQGYLCFGAVVALYYVNDGFLVTVDVMSDRSGFTCRV